MNPKWKYYELYHSDLSKEEKNELYHAGRKGMKWGKSIFDKLGDIGESLSGYKDSIVDKAKKKAADWVREYETEQRSEVWDRANRREAELKAEGKGFFSKERREARSDANRELNEEVDDEFDPEDKTKNFIGRLFGLKPKSVGLGRRFVNAFMKNFKGRYKR